MPDISANILKTQGIASIETALATHTEATISVRGKDRYVVMELAQYHYLRECELSAALAETHADIAASRFVRETPEEHVARLEKMR